jgi:hypothetical protein
MARVYNKKNYLTTAAEKLDVESTIRTLSKTLTTRLNYDLCTQELENKLMYLRSRLEYLERNS